MPTSTSSRFSTQRYKIAVVGLGDLAGSSIVGDLVDTFVEQGTLCQKPCRVILDYVTQERYSLISDLGSEVYPIHLHYVKELASTPTTTSCKPTSQPVMDWLTKQHVAEGVIFFSHLSHWSSVHRIFETLQIVGNRRIPFVLVNLQPQQGDRSILGTESPQERETTPERTNGPPPCASSVLSAMSSFFDGDYAGLMYSVGSSGECYVPHAEICTVFSNLIQSMKKPDIVLHTSEVLHSPTTPIHSDGHIVQPGDDGWLPTPNVSHFTLPTLSGNDRSFAVEDTRVCLEGRSSQQTLPSCTVPLRNVANHQTTNPRNSVSPSPTSEKFSFASGCQYPISPRPSTTLSRSTSCFSLKDSDHQGEPHGTTQRISNQGPLPAIDDTTASKRISSFYPTSIPAPATVGDLSVQFPLAFVTQPTDDCPMTEYRAWVEIYAQECTEIPSSRPTAAENVNTEGSGNTDLISPYLRPFVMRTKIASRSSLVTVPALVDRLVGPGIYRDVRFANIFLMVYLRFMSARRLLYELLVRFLEGLHGDKTTLPTRLRVCYVLTLWVTGYWHDFVTAPPLGMAQTVLPRGLLSVLHTFVAECTKVSALKLACRKLNEVLYSHEPSLRGQSSTSLADIVTLLDQDLEAYGSVASFATSATARGSGTASSDSLLHRRHIVSRRSSITDSGSVGSFSQSTDTDRVSPRTLALDDSMPPPAASISVVVSSRASGDSRVPLATSSAERMDSTLASPESPPPLFHAGMPEMLDRQPHTNANEKLLSNVPSAKNSTTSLAARRGQPSANLQVQLPSPTLDMLHSPLPSTPLSPMNTNITHHPATAPIRRESTCADETSAPPSPLILDAGLDRAKSCYKPGEERTARGESQFDTATEPLKVPTTSGSIADWSARIFQFKKPSRRQPKTHEVNRVPSTPSSIVDFFTKLSRKSSHPVDTPYDSYQVSSPHSTSTTVDSLKENAPGTKTDLGVNRSRRITVSRRIRKYSTYIARPSFTVFSGVDDNHPQTPSTLETNPHGDSAMEEAIQRKLQVLCNFPPNEFVQIDCKCVAQQLTIIEHQLFLDIHPRHLLHYLWRPKQRTADQWVRSLPSIQDDQENDVLQSPTQRSRQEEYLSLGPLFDHFNYVAAWVASKVLCHTDLTLRAKSFMYFIDVADQLLSLGNFNTLMAVLAGLNSNPIYRLYRTRAVVQTQRPDYWDRWQHLNEVVSSKRSYRAYRKLLQESALPCIPYLGCWLKDLIFVDEAFTETRGVPSQATSTPSGDGKDHSSLSTKSLYWRKFEVIGDMVLLFRKLQSEAAHSEFPWQESDYIIQMLLSQSCFDEEEAYHRSLRLEPRRPSNDVTT
ncbi:hypothetical protein IWQ62_002045 [Dispira parvispora]|uniref:Ras-GEF domain-containing protein n=1 Tax=Dispira parvispora TaxID=1520584 RepID=A0A9W8AWI4_9FUNG|nr:hypothetical protein IWQ62_002045 [Dispira parvispora]